MVIFMHPHNIPNPGERETSRVEREAGGGERGATGEVRERQEGAHPHSQVLAYYPPRYITNKVFTLANIPYSRLYILHRYLHVCRSLSPTINCGLVRTLKQ